MSAVLKTNKDQHKMLINSPPSGYTDRTSSQLSPLSPLSGPLRAVGQTMYNGYSSQSYYSPSHLPNADTTSSTVTNVNAPAKPIQLPPGKSDLEILQRLKDIIKNGQHEMYRAVPMPAALASHYLGPANAVARTEDTAPSGQSADKMDVDTQSRSSSTVASSVVSSMAPDSATTHSTRPPRLQKDAWDPSAPKRSTTRSPTRSTLAASPVRLNITLTYVLHF
jgi:hypothetical protein